MAGGSFTISNVSIRSYPLRMYLYANVVLGWCFWFFDGYSYYQPAADWYDSFISLFSLLESI